MKTVNLRQAKAQLTKLIQQAVKGESFIIAKAGNPLVKVTAISALTGERVQRFGFLAGQIAVPDDFDRMSREEIERIFGVDMTRN